MRSKEYPGKFDNIIGVDQIDKVIDIDQSPIGRTPRSNPATYTGAVHPHPRPVRQAPGVEGAGIQGRPVFLQCAGRAVRIVRGRRGQKDRDAFSARRVHHLRGVQGEAVQPRDPRGPLQGEEHLRGAGHDRRGGTRISSTTSRPSGTKLETLNQRGAGVHQARAAGHDPLRRRGPAGQALARAVEAGHGQDPLHPRRAHDGPPFRRHPASSSTCSSPWWTRGIR